MVLKQITLSVEEDNLALIDKAAELKRQSRSGYMEIAALEQAKADLQ